MYHENLVNNNFLSFSMQAEEDVISPPKPDFSAPPPYDVATKLPSYEEVQREKTLQGEAIPHIHPQIHVVIILIY